MPLVIVTITTPVYITQFVKGLSSQGGHFLYVDICIGSHRKCIVYQTSVPTKGMAIDKSVPIKGICFENYIYPQ